MQRSTANLLLLLAGLIWGGGFVAQATAMEDIGPSLFMSLRMSLAALALLPLALIEHRKSGSQSPFFAELMGKGMGASAFYVGVAFFLAMILQQVGLLTTTVTNAGILTGLYVVMVPIMVLLIFGERQLPIVWPCALASFVGIWLLGGGSLNGLTIGDGLVILGAAFSAAHVILLGRTVKNQNRPAQLACFQFAYSAGLSMLCFAVLRGFDVSFEPAVSQTTLIAAAPEILYAAFLAGAVSFTLMAYCQQYTDAADAAILLSSEALFAAICGAIFLGERLTMTGYLGCAILFAAIATVGVASARQDD